jgi:hypothetical protein
MSSQFSGLGYYNNPANYPSGKKTTMGPPTPMPQMPQMPSVFNSGMGLVRSNAFTSTLKKGGKHGRRTRHRRRNLKRSMRRMRRSRRH